MAVSVVSAAGAASTVSSYTMSLVQGWDLIPPEHAGRRLAAGDLILLEVRKPQQVTAPPDWTSLGEFPWVDDGRKHAGHLFCKIIGPREIDPLHAATSSARRSFRRH